MQNNNNQNISDPYHSEVKPYRPLYARDILVVNGPQANLNWFQKIIGGPIESPIMDSKWDSVENLRGILHEQVREWRPFKPLKPLMPALWQVGGDKPKQLPLPQVAQHKDGPTPFLRFKLLDDDHEEADALQVRDRLNDRLGSIAETHGLPPFPVTFSIDRIAGLLSRKGVGSPNHSAPQTRIPGAPDGINYLPLINWEEAKRKKGEDGEGVTVMILDTAPDDPTPNQPYQYWLDLSEKVSFLGPKGETVPDLDPKVHGVANPKGPGGTVELSHEEMEQYHGLLIASIVQNIAPKATIILVKVLNDEGENLESSLRCALARIYDYCTGAKDDPILGPILKPEKLVLNLSWGLFLSLYPKIDYPDMRVACEKLCSLGVTVVAAVGNDTVINKSTPTRKREFPAEPAAYGFDYKMLGTTPYEALIAGIPEFNDPAFPGFNAMDQVIPVAATHKPKGTGYATFSDFGSLGAPGQSILIEIKGGASIPVENAGTTTQVKEIVWSGTSFATPQVAAAAALLLQQGVSPAQVKECLIKSAENRPAEVPPHTKADVFETHVPKLDIRKALDSCKPGQGIQGT